MTGKQPSPNADRPTSSRSTSRPANATWIAATVFVFAFVARSALSEAHGWRFTLFDDATISMTYARTLSETGELVWFPGAPRVQGFTNTLWTLFMALCHLVTSSPDKVNFLVITSGTIILAATAITIVKISRFLEWSEKRTPSPAAHYAGALVPLIYPTAFWTLRGMEVGLLAFFTVLLCSSALHSLDDSTSLNGPRLRFTASLSLIALLGVCTRLDFVVVVVPILFTTYILRRDERRHLDALFTFGLLIVGIFLVLGFQQLYYDSPTPNTYALKVRGFPLTERAAVGLFHAFKVLPLLSALLIFSWASRAVFRTSRSAQLTLLSTLILASVLSYSVFVGGDAWESRLMIGRYVATALPLSLAAVILGLRFGVADSMKLRVAVVPSALLVLAICAEVIMTEASTARFAAVSLLLLLSAVVVLTVLLSRSFAPVTSRSNSITKALLLAPLLVITSLIGLVDWAANGGLHIADDRQMRERGHALADLTAPEGTIATVWAGAPAYYSARPMIDLLGKSDPAISAATPRGRFYPGHNKWDYSYSIGEKRPDIVHQFWREAPSSQQMKFWGYESYCYASAQVSFQLWVRADSRSVNRDLLAACK